MEAEVVAVGDKVVPGEMSEDPSKVESKNTARDVPEPIDSEDRHKNAQWILSYSTPCPLHLKAISIRSKVDDVLIMLCEIEAKHTINE